MEETSNLCGRKVFFLYPPNTVSWGEVFSLLFMAEYEIYTVHEHTKLRKLLKRFPNSIVLVNIDERLTKEQWETWIFAAMRDPDLAGTDIGVLTSDRSSKLKEKYEAQLGLRGGVTLLTADVYRLFGRLTDKLRGLGAMGRRKYLRAEFSSASNLRVSVHHRGYFLNGVIRDLSSAGFSCFFPDDPRFNDGDLLADIQLKLRGVILRAEGMVLGVRMEADTKIYVMVFTARTDPHTRGLIRKYIQSILHRQMEAELARVAGETGCDF